MAKEAAALRIRIINSPLTWQCSMLRVQVKFCFFLLSLNTGGGAVRHANVLKFNHTCQLTVLNFS